MPGSILPTSSSLAVKWGCRPLEREVDSGMILAGPNILLQRARLPCRRQFSWNKFGSPCVCEKESCRLVEEFMRQLVCSLLLSALALSAAGLSGKWSGTFDITNSNGETKADTAYMNLREHGGEVTGTAGPNSEKQWSLQKGKLDGQKLTFEVPTDDGGLLVFDLMFNGEAIQGSCAGTGRGGEKMSAKVRLKRASD
jgi:hypothetical protein